VADWRAGGPHGSRGLLTFGTACGAASLMLHLVPVPALPVAATLNGLGLAFFRHHAEPHRHLSRPEGRRAISAFSLAGSITNFVGRW
jgi:hypothetical protein